MTAGKKVFTFIDNSNLFIEAKRIARASYAYDDDGVFRLRINFGSLVELVVKNRPMGPTVLVGSRPPAEDSLWEALKRKNITPRIFDRSFHTGREKGVDAEMINAMRDVMEENTTTGILAVVAGDGDYLSTLERALKKGWEVEVYFWSNANGELKRLKGSRFIELDQFFTKISFLGSHR